MSNSVFKKWTSAVLYLNEKIKNNRLIAGRNIQLENTGNGIRIHGSASNNPGNNGDTYNGYFKLIKDDETYSVVDGSNPHVSPYYPCGFVIIGNARRAVASISLEEIGANGVFYIETTYVSPNYISVVKFAATWIAPASENGKDICLIADLKDGTPIQRLFGEHKIVRWV